jgi:uncharacterized protein YegL
MTATSDQGLTPPPVATTATTTAAADPPRPSDVVLLLDESGSMARIQRATIDSVNEFIQHQRDLANVRFTLITFRGEHTTVRDRVPMNSVETLSEEHYSPRGMTALYDAIADVLTCEKLTSSSGSAIVCIVTDGHDTASTQHTLVSLRPLFQQRKEQGWQFVFLGANIDAASSAQELSIGAQAAMQFQATGRGVKSMMRTVSQTVHDACSSDSGRMDYSSLSGAG